MPSKEYEDLVESCSALFFYGSEVDSWLIEMAMLPYISLHWKQLPVWLRIIAPPGCGKSAHLSLVERYKTTYSIDSLTPKSFISGYRGNNEDPSQLPMMNNKVLLLPDESTIMEQRREDRNLIQAILRKAYDGRVTKAFGNLREKVEHNAVFNMLIASTPVIDRYYLYNQALGERYINFRLQVPDKKSITERAMWNQSHGFVLKRKRLAKKVHIFLNKLEKSTFSSVKIGKKTAATLVQCASFIALIRTHVMRDSTGRYVTILPQPEVASRLVQQMTQVAVGNAIIRGEKRVREHQRSVAIYTALCSAPSLTIYVLSVVWEFTIKKNAKWFTVKELMMATHMGQLSTRNVIEDLCIHRVLRMRRGKSQGGRLIQYAFSKYGRETIAAVKLFKHYSHGMDHPSKRRKDRYRG